MSERSKELILKTLMVIDMILLIMFFPGGILLSFLVPNQETFDFIYNIILFSLLGVGGLFMLLLPIFGGLKQKPVKADKATLTFESYDCLLKYLKESLIEKGYKEQNVVSIPSNGEVVVFLKKSIQGVLHCFTVIKVPELSEELIEISNETITKVLIEYYGNKTIRDSVASTSMFCVDRVTPAFQKLVNSNLQQGLKNSRLVAGVSFGGKKIYIAKQEDGFAIAKYKRLRKEFINIMNLSDINK